MSLGPVFGGSNMKPCRGDTPYAYAGPSASAQTFRIVVSRINVKSDSAMYPDAYGNGFQRTLRPDLELAVMDRDGLHPLVFPFRRVDGSWIEASTKRPVNVQPDSLASLAARVGRRAGNGQKHACSRTQPLSQVSLHGYKQHCYNVRCHLLRGFLRSRRQEMTVPTFSVSQLLGTHGKPKKRKRAVKVTRTLTSPHGRPPASLCGVGMSPIPLRERLHAGPDPQPTLRHACARGLVPIR